jgi:hypothetical protein
MLGSLQNRGNFVNALESRPHAETVVRKLEKANSADLVFASGRSMRVSKYLGGFVSQGDEVRFALPAESGGFGNPELLIKPASGPCLLSDGY